MDNVEDLNRRFVAAQLSGDRREGLRLIEEGLEEGVSVPRLQLDVIAPAQVEIGRLWQENRITVAQEHVATAISQLALAHLYQHLPRRARAQRLVMVACVEAEQHDMGARMLADFLEMEGFEVRYLGANVPTESLVELVRVERPDLLALSVTLTFHAPALARAVQEVRRVMGEGFVIAGGGHAFACDPRLAETKGLSLSAPGAQSFATKIREVLRVDGV